MLTLHRNICPFKTDGAPETNGTNGTDATNGDAEKPKELSSEEQQSKCCSVMFLNKISMCLM